MAGTQAVLTSVIFALSIRRGEGGLSQAELVMIAIAGAGVAGWIVADEPIVATACVVAADLVGAALMLPKTYRDPESETLVTFALASVGGALAAGAVGARSTSRCCSIRVYYCVVNAAIALLIWQRRPSCRLSPPEAAAPRARACPRPGGLSTLSEPSQAPTRSARPAQAGAGAGLARRRRRRRATSTTSSLVARCASRTVAWLASRVLGHVGERLGDREVGGRLDRRRQPLVAAPRRPRPAPARARRAPRSPARGRARSAPPGGCRGRARAARRTPRASSSPRRSRNGAGRRRGPCSACARATRTSSASATSRCCAPSWRSRSILRRAASAASTMRAREARSSSVRAASTSRRRSASSASRRSVMSKIAPSIHSRPPGPAHELAAVEHPADLAVGADDPVLERERPVASSRACSTASQHRARGRRDG